MEGKNHSKDRVDLNFLQKELTLFYEIYNELNGCYMYNPMIYCKQGRSVYELLQKRSPRPFFESSSKLIFFSPVATLETAFFLFSYFCLLYLRFLLKAAILPNRSLNSAALRKEQKKGESITQEKKDFLFYY